MSVKYGAQSLFFVLLLITGCNGNKNPPPQTTNSSADPALNDVAVFLAGMPGRAAGPFHALEQTNEWKSYSTQLQATWSDAQSSQFASVDQFQKRELSSVSNANSFVFYPFSGPDVLYVTHFFPQGQVYVLAGLERVGELKTSGGYAKDLNAELSGWKQALNSIFNRSFFVTSEMDRQFHGRVANGIFPMILLLLARSGYVIEGADYGHLDGGGKFIQEAAGNGVRHMGVEIRFHRKNENLSRKLFYFSTKLGPEFEQDRAFEKFLASQGKPETLVKSASFLLHWQMCSALRSYILDNSRLILEDDTGVPYRYFQNAAWQVRLFGEYSRPDHPFTREYQRDLAQAFQDPAKVKELGFNLGYGAGRRPSSLILATRSK